MDFRPCFLAKWSRRAGPLGGGKKGLTQLPPGTAPGGSPKAEYAVAPRDDPWRLPEASLFGYYKNDICNFDIYSYDAEVGLACPGTAHIVDKVALKKYAKSYRKCMSALGPWSQQREPHSLAPRLHLAFVIQSLHLLATYLIHTVLLSLIAISLYLSLYLLAILFFTCVGYWGFSIGTYPFVL